MMMMTVMMMYSQECDAFDTTIALRFQESFEVSQTELVPIQINRSVSHHTFFPNCSREIRENKFEHRTRHRSTESIEIAVLNRDSLRTVTVICRCSQNSSNPRSRLEFSYLCSSAKRELSFRTI